MQRRTFTKLWAAAGVAAPAFALNSALAQSSAAPQGETLQSEFLLDMVFDKGPSNNVGSVGVNRVVVPVLGGAFTGPKLKGTVAGPGGDWITVRPDGSSLLDLRMLLVTDDAQKIYVSWRGIAYQLPDKTLFARILPMFETGSAKYAWLNNVVAVGVYHEVPGKVAYRVYQIL